MGKRPGTYPEYANGCNFCANTLAYAKFGNGFVRHAYFLTNLKYANKLPRHMYMSAVGLKSNALCNLSFKCCVIEFEVAYFAEKSETVVYMRGRRMVNVAILMI